MKSSDDIREELKSLKDKLEGVVTPTPEQEEMFDQIPDLERELTVALAYEEGDHEALDKMRNESPWVICPVCNGDGHHAKHLGSFTSTEFHECFDDEESRASYFSGGYDTGCQTCSGSGKIKDFPLDWYKASSELRMYRMQETGRNEAGEPI